MGARGRIIARIRGGLGNQLFCYAAARRLALANDAELVIDDVTGFVRDHVYRRQYALDRFAITARKATASERLEPFERYRRGAMKWLARRVPYERRRYIEQETRDFDQRLLTRIVQGTAWIDGLWQSEDYFKDVAQVIRSDLRMPVPPDGVSQRVAAEIRASTAVAVHVRWFDAPGVTGANNVSADYYHRAIDFFERNAASPRYFLFSDDPRAARAKLPLPSDRVSAVVRGQVDADAWADLWLMSQCRHFITANSTFSWWGAWLGADEEKIVVCPGMKMTTATVGAVLSWNFAGQIPDDWIRL